MKILIVNGQNYLFPEESDSPPWGALVTDWATAVTGVLDEVVGVGDIVETSAAINNNVTTPTNVTALTFNSTSVRGAIVDYSIYRVTTGGSAQESVEIGTMYLSYRPGATAGTKWGIVIVGGGSSSIAGNTLAGVTFSMKTDDSGQLQYVSTSMTGLNYSGIIKFRARALTQ